MNKDGSLEILRAWIAEGSQHFTLRVDIWEDPAAWGIFLADLLRNVAEAYHQKDGVDVDYATQRILAGFSAEIGS